MLIILFINNYRFNLCVSFEVDSFYSPIGMKFYINHYYHLYIRDILLFLYFVFFFNYFVFCLNESSRRNKHTHIEFFRFVLLSQRKIEENLIHNKTKDPIQAFAISSIGFFFLCYISFTHLMDSCFLSFVYDAPIFTFDIIYSYFDSHLWCSDSYICECVWVYLCRFIIESIADCVSHCLNTTNKKQ